MPNDQFGERLRKARNAAGLTQKELAERAGTDHTHISHLESGRRNNPTLGLARSIANALGLTTGELIEGELTDARYGS